MQYTVYIGSDCHHCQDVVEFMRYNRIPHRVVHLGKDKEEPPIDLFVFPALFRDDKLVGYGTDIMDFLQPEIAKTRKVGIAGLMRIGWSRLLGSGYMLWHVIRKFPAKPVIPEKQDET
ncbi:MAG: hypothetical protein AAGB22_09410 [Bacteroidota bacterium]